MWAGVADAAAGSAIRALIADSEQHYPRSHIGVLLLFGQGTVGRLVEYEAGLVVGVSSLPPYAVCSTPGYKIS